MGAASDTEKEKREHAEDMVRDAIRSDPALSRRTIKVFAQGSYRNNTNVRRTAMWIPVSVAWMFATPTLTSPMGTTAMMSD